MGKCPNEDCQKNVSKRLDGHDKTLYGQDGIGGVVSCLKKFVTKASVRWTVAITIPFIFLAFVSFSDTRNVLKSVEETTVRINKEIEDGYRRETRIKVLENQYIDLKCAVSDLKKQQRDDTEKILLAIDSIKR